MPKKRTALIIAIAIVMVAGLAYASLLNPRQQEIQKYFQGHSHSDGVTINAPNHSGGTDRYGCHNASVPYHCH